VKRILPSALLVLTVTVLASHYLFPASRAKETLLDALYADVFAANFRFEAVGADYFQQNLPPSPLQHYWSLSIEEQFYFVWPALLVLIFALTRQRRRRAKGLTRQWGLLGAMSVVVIASFGWAMFLSVDDPNRAYFSSLTRVWELGVGALVAIAGPWLLRIPPIVRPVLAYSGLTGVLASLFLIDSRVQWPAPWAVLPVLSTAVVVASFHGADVRGMFPLTNPVARYFGDTSYTLYLWHWPVFVLLLTVVSKGPLYYAIAIAVALGLTAVTYRFYENPIRNSNWLLEITVPQARRLLFTGAVAASVIVMTILAVGYAGRLSAARNTSASPQDGQAASGSAQTDPCFGAPAILNSGCALRNPAVPLQPSVDTFSTDYVSEARKCYAAKQGALMTCDFGYMGNDAKRIALVGDSHATILLPGLRPILSANKWRLTTYTGKGCVLVEPAPEACTETLPKIEAELLARPFDLVLVTNYRFFNQDSTTPGEVARDFQRAWAPIISAGSRIAVVADNPETSREAIECLTRVSIGGERTGECGTARTEALRRPDPLVAGAQLVPGVTVIDLTPYYCTADRCPSVIGDVIVYMDANHITGTFAETLAGPLEEGLRRALAGA
jgi:peptidoglycan/LPS O-acetylase OafA/YrhL